jgi:hypothetical protein
MVTWNDFYRRYILPEIDNWSDTDLLYAEMLWSKDLLGELHGINRLKEWLTEVISTTCSGRVIEAFNRHFKTMTREIQNQKASQKTNVVLLHQKRVITEEELHYLEQLEAQKDKQVFTC